MTKVYHQFSEALKQRLVADIEAGHLSLREAARDAQTSVARIQTWLDEYGRYRPKRDIVEVVMRSEQAQIAALEKALAEAHLQLKVYDTLIAQANQHYGTDLKKSFGTPPSGSAAPGRTRPPSAPSAASSAAPATPTTSASAAPARRTTRRT